MRAKRPRMVRHAELVAADERASVLAARLERTRSAVGALLQQFERVMSEGHSTNAQQAALRDVRAVLAEET